MRMSAVAFYFGLSSRNERRFIDLFQLNPVEVDFKQAIGSRLKVSILQSDPAATCNRYI
jgi:hypothetical protein